MVCEMICIRNKLVVVNKQLNRMKNDLKRKPIYVTSSFPSFHHIHLQSFMKRRY